MNLCEYSDIFGKVGKGIHSYRLYNIAMIDLVLTIILSWIISKYYEYNIFIVFGILIIISIIIHRLFCVRSTLTMLVMPF